MEVCGTHTHAIARAGLKSLIREHVELISGPGCPVCVTAPADIERMLSLAREPSVTVTTFGDLLRVPGHESSLELERARGARIRVVYSPHEALTLARAEPDRQIVFLAVGFETTAPCIAAVVQEAIRTRTRNLSIYVALKRIPPAMAAVLSGETRLDGFLTPGHVSVIIGSQAYEPLARTHGVPCVATGFTPPAILEGLAMLAELVADRRAVSDVQYRQAVTPAGNPVARAAMAAVFAGTDAVWRGLGTISDSGFALQAVYRDLDVTTRFALAEPVAAEDVPGCRCGDVLKGLLQPDACPLFGRRCRPERPVGPCMVSSEGACAARYRYGE